MSKYNFLYALNNAIEGIIHTVKTQKHMKIHLLVSLFVIIFALLVNIQVSDLLTILILIALVIVCELFNTAMEYLLDMLNKDFHITIKYIKDVCAGAVLFSSIIALLVGGNIFSKYIFPLKSELIRHNYVVLMSVSLFFVIVTVIGIKAILKSGLPLRGGMPSGHSAISFSLLTSILMISDSFWINIISLIVALIVSFSRMWKGIHKGSEVILGAVIGSLITYLVLLLYEK
jgi:diacylglycerol kinase (ATP)